MKVVVVGSGLLGLTSAWFLRRCGCEVTIVERERGPGLQTSFANGALLTPSMPEPWNAPGSWRTLLASLVRSDLPLQLRARALPGLSGWGLQFLSNSRVARFADSTRKNLRLALYSLEVLHELCRETGIDYGGVASGTLKVFRDERSFELALIAAGELAAEGLQYRRLSRPGILEVEPALAPIADQLAGAIHYPADESGDAYRFCVALAECLRVQGVEFIFGADVSALELRSGRVTGLHDGDTRMRADFYVVAAGSYSTSLLSTVGIRLPVQPAKGYSVTFDSAETVEAPGTSATPATAGSLRIPVIDDHLHAAVIPLGRSIRVAGTAEFAGYDHSISPARVQNLLALVQRILPEANLPPASSKSWCGLRPMSADGVPIIGRTRIPNLLVNTGHGHLGWTMAAGSGRLLADLLCGQQPGLEEGAYALARFG